MASFQAKIGWKRPRKRKNKNYRSIPFLTDGIKKHHYGLFSRQNRLENAEKERK